MDMPKGSGKSGCGKRTQRKHQLRRGGGLPGTLETREHHDGGRGSPCNYCACSAGEPPNAFEVGVIHSLHEMTLALVRLVKEVQGKQGT